MPRHPWAYENSPKVAGALERWMLEHGQKKNCQRIMVSMVDVWTSLDNFGQFWTMLEFGAIYSNAKMDRFMYFPGWWKSSMIQIIFSLNIRMHMLYLFWAVLTLYFLCVRGLSLSSLIVNSKGDIAWDCQWDCKMWRNDCFITSFL